MTKGNKMAKSFLKKITAFLMALCMALGFFAPFAPVTASAAAPTTYSTITAGASASVSLTSANPYRYFRFIPTQSGKYRFYSSSNSGDAYGTLLDAGGNTLAYDDDGAGNLNFSITYDCIANTTYYVQARMLNTSSAGSFTVNVETISPVEPTTPTTPTLPTTPTVGKILVVQDNDPWGRQGNQNVMSYLLTEEYIDGYEIVTTSQFASENLSEYSVIYVVTNDDATSASSANAIYDDVLAFANAGGTVIYGIAWQSSRTMSLPLGATATRVTSTENIITDTDHPIITGSLTGGNTSLTSPMSGNSISHSYLYSNMLPQGTNVILSYDNNGNATLVEYPCGQGNVILSCLTWEYFYNSSYLSQYPFSMTCYDDLFVYALALSGANGHQHSYAQTSRVDATCTADGVIYSACSCGATSESVLTALGHSFVGGVCTRCNATEAAGDIWDGTVANGFGGGSGTQVDPYLIYDGEELAYLAQRVNGGTTYEGYYFKLMNDIDLNNIEWAPIGIGENVQYDATTLVRAFQGYFDGNHRTVSNLRITQKHYGSIGLFGRVGGGSIYNLGVINVDINVSINNDDYAYFGGLVGMTYQEDIRACFVTGTIVDTNSTANSWDMNGGVVGAMDGGSLENCYAACNLTVTTRRGGNYGGLVGNIRNSATVTKCYAVGSISYVGNSGNGTRVGGLVGHSGNYTLSYVFSDVDMQVSSGGEKNYGTMVGYNSSATLSSAYYSSSQTMPSGCKTNGMATDVSNFASQSWIESYLGWDFANTWEMKANASYPTLRDFDGGEIVAPHQHSYAETSRVDATCTADGVVYTACSCGATSESVLTALGHSFVGGVCTRCNATEAVGDIWDGTVANGFGGGSGTSADPYLIYNGEELAYLAQRVNGGITYNGYYFRLMNDIDLNDIEWTPIGSSNSAVSGGGKPFSGNFDGNGCVISNLLISQTSSSSAYGLFALLASARIYNLGLENVDIRVTATTSGWISAGGIFGCSTDLTTIDSCYVSGNVVVSNSTSNPGSIAGLLGGSTRTSSTSVNNSYTMGYVEAYSIGTGSDPSSKAGGILGESGNISNCYSLANVKTISNSGRLFCCSNIVGMLQSGDVTNTYGSTAQQVVGSNYNSRCTLLAPEDFKTAGNFVGFDFDSVWEIKANADYPTLKCFAGNAVTPPAHQHSYAETSRVDATCTADGVIYFACSCGATNTETLEATGHDYQETSNVQPTCITEGCTVETCTHCGDTEETTIPTTEHTFVGDRCAFCGSQKAMGDTWDGTTDTSWYSSDLSEFTITTAEQLAGLARLVNNGATFSGKTVYLDCDIDLAGQEWTPIGVGILTSSTPSPASLTSAFKGTFNGNHHKILNLSIENNTTTYTGLFGVVASGYILNLGVENPLVRASVPTDYRSKAGALVGMLGGSTIQNCYVVGADVSNYASTKPSSTGILVGLASTTSCYITNCYVQGSVQGNAHVAMLVGGTYSGDITFEKCYAVGNAVVEGQDTGGVTCVGAAVGYTTSAAVSVSHCFFNGTLNNEFTNSASDNGAFYGASNNTTVSSSYHSYNGFGSAQGTATDVSNFASQSWIESYLGWDFANTWEMKANASYPTLQGFAEGGVTPPTVHIHSFAETARIEAGCTTYGEVAYACACGETRSELLAPLQHNYQVTNTVEPTCTEDGYIEFTCQNGDCGVTKRQTLERLGHDYGDDNVCDRCDHTIEIHTHVYTMNTVEPTCTTMGYTEYVCDCGYNYRGDYVEPTRHQWDDGVTTIEKTCTTDGLLTYTCQSCYATKTAVITAGHAWSEEITVEKTCTTAGAKCKTCSVCNAEEVEIIPAGHNWNEGVETSAASCETEGAKTCACLDCGVAQSFVIPALGHTYVDGTCTRCGEKFIDNIKSSEHPLYGMYFEIDDILSDYGPSLIDEYGLMLDYNDDANLEKVAVYLVQEGTMWRRCIAVKGTNIEYATYVPYLSYQSEIKYTGLNHDWINVFRLKENADGIWCYSNYTTIGVNLQDAYGNLLLSLYDIGQAGAQTRIFDDLDEMIDWLKNGCVTHTAGDWIVDVPATCVSGSQHKECTVCGELLETEEIPPVGEHVAGGWITDVAPTPTQTGIKHTECIVCGAIVETQVISLLPRISIDNVSAKAGSTVRVAINIQNTPGVLGAVLTVEYDPALTLISAESGAAWSSLSFTRPSGFTNPCNFVWDGVNTPDYNNGAIVILTFELPNDATPNTRYNIGVSYAGGGIFDENLEALDIETVDGSITVLTKEQMLGDVNDNGVVDVADVIILRRYLAGGYGVEIDRFASDMNGDGNINVQDIVLLRRFLVG